MTVPAALPVLGTYLRLVVAFSGGKDSLAALLHLLAPGVPAHAIELHHHDVDGHGPPFMEWPCTPRYVRAIETAQLRTPLASRHLPMCEHWFIRQFEK